MGIAEAFVAGSRFSTYKDAIAFCILILVLLVKPAGLLGKNVAEWIAHEFEHVLEQAEGLRASDLRKQQSSWMSDGLAFETTRAIVAGRAVREQMRRKPTAMAAAN